MCHTVCRLHAQESSTCKFYKVWKKCLLERSRAGESAKKDVSSPLGPRFLNKQVHEISGEFTGHCQFYICSLELILHSFLFNNLENKTCLYPQISLHKWLKFPLFLSPFLYPHTCIYVTYIHEIARNVEVTFHLKILLILDF